MKQKFKMKVLQIWKQYKFKMNKLKAQDKINKLFLKFNQKI